MDKQTYLDNMVKAERQRKFEKSDQLTLGEIISKLEPIVEKQQQRIKEGKDEAEVVFDFEYLYPTKIDSWRGSYAELALNFVDSDSSEVKMTVSQFTEMLKNTVRKEFTGYKGGEYIMSRHTPVWVANYGNSGSTAVIEIVDNEYDVIIITGYREF